MCLAAALALLWHDQHSGRPDTRAESRSPRSEPARPVVVDPAPLQLMAAPIAADAARTAPSGRPPGLRIPRRASAPPQCVRVEWSWPYAPETSGPVTLRMLRNGVTYREVTTEARRLVVMMPPADFYGAVLVGEMGDRRDGVPAVRFEAGCED